MSKFIKSIDIDKLQQAAIFVTDNGTIDKINTGFTSLLGWKPNELAKQNVSLLVSPKLMKKSAHDALLKGYKLNKDSRIVGKPRILPCKNVDDEEIFLSVQIIPIGTAGNFCFLAFFSAGHEKVSYISDEDMIEAITSNLSKLPKGEDLATPGKTGTTELISLIKTFLEEEVTIMQKFLYDNYQLEEAWKLAKFLLFNRRLGKMSHLYDMLVKHNESPKAMYTNIIWFRILLPLFSKPTTPDDMKPKITKFSQEVRADAQKSHTSSGSFGSSN